MSKNVPTNMPDSESIKAAPESLTEIQDYCKSAGLQVPASAPVVKQIIAEANNHSGYKIFKSPPITDQDFAIASHAPGIEKIALACCNKLAPLTTFEKMWENNTPAVVEVGIVNGGFETKTRVDEILDYLEGRNNVKIKFYLSAAGASSKALAIDTLGNFSTDCTGIEYHAKSYTDFDHLLMEILPFSSFVTGEPPANPFTD